ncbi:Leucine-rich repeat-containing protein 47 [Nymphon striatum]|nr:Leucine-rich repeat-containing protein 47 [Nymphon striatum]
MSGKALWSILQKTTSSLLNNLDVDLRTHDYGITVLHVSEETPVVKSTVNVSSVRPYIVCCIVRSIDLLSQKVFKNFISLQTKLHDSICEKRNIATIATHDLSKIKGNLLYNALDPETVMIQPLMRNKAVSLGTLYQQLREEAEALRKEKKRNVFSGIHKYLYLLDHKTVFPFLSDAAETVISFPPITNSDVSKISPTTTDLFLEVTSNDSYIKCKTVMDQLLLEIVKSDLATVDETNENFKHITVEQVKIVDEEFNLKLVYPSRTDLNFDNVDVSYE